MYKLMFLLNKLYKSLLKHGIKTQGVSPVLNFVRVTILKQVDRIKKKGANLHINIKRQRFKLRL